MIENDELNLAHLSAVVMTYYSDAAKKEIAKYLSASTMSIDGVRVQDITPAMIDALDSREAEGLADAIQCEYYQRGNTTKRCADVKISLLDGVLKVFERYVPAPIPTEEETPVCTLDISTSPAEYAPKLSVTECVLAAGYSAKQANMIARDMYGQDLGQDGEVWVQAWRDQNPGKTFRKIAAPSDEDSQKAHASEVCAAGTGHDDAQAAASNPRKGDTSALIEMGAEEMMDAITQFLKSSFLQNYTCYQISQALNINNPAASKAVEDLAKNQSHTGILKSVVQKSNKSVTLYQYYPFRVLNGKKTPNVEDVGKFIVNLLFAKGERSVAEITAFVRAYFSAINDDTVRAALKIKSVEDGPLTCELGPRNSKIYSYFTA